MSSEATSTEAFIKAYQELLQEKGYSEDGLNNQEPPGKLAACIRRSFEECAGNKEKAELALIAISVYGHMPEDHEKFTLTFNFSYITATGKFDLDFMEADTKDFHIKIKPLVDNNIPTLTDLHKHFKETAELIRIKANHEKQQINGKKRVNGNRFRLN
jgi:hypothetical protein